MLLTPDCCVLGTNPRFSELFGLEADVIVGRHIDALGNRLDQWFADPTTFRSLVANCALPQAAPFSVTIAQQLPEQRDLHLFSTSVSTVDGAALGRLYVFRDVTKERAAERVKTVFVALVSHELRTRLTSIKGYIDLLAAGDAGPLTAGQPEFVGIVKSSADRLASLINDLLDISRIDAGKVELLRRPLSLGLLLQHVATILRPQLDARQQSLRVVTPPDLPVLEGDANCLIQVFTNLLSNASKYISAGGAVRIEANAGHGLVQVDVTDTGIGMTTEELAQLFTRFFRSSNRLARKAGGTGLGLTISRSLVELHGGQMAVTSTPGRGSTFSVRLPMDAGVLALAVSR